MSEKVNWHLVQTLTNKHTREELYTMLETRTTEKYQIAIPHAIKNRALRGLS